MEYNRPLRKKVVDSINHKQWIALGSFVNQSWELCWKSIGGKSNRQILADSCFAEVFQGQLLALLLGQQLPFDCLQRMPAHNQLHRSIGTNQHKLRWVALPRQI